MGAQIRKFVNLPIQISEFLLEKISHRATGGSSCAVHPKDFCQLMKRETCSFCRGYPFEILDFSRGPEPVPSGRSLRFRHDSESLIVADTIRPHPGDTSNLTDRQFLRRHVVLVVNIIDLGTVSKVKCLVDYDFDKP